MKVIYEDIIHQSDVDLDIQMCGSSFQRGVWGSLGRTETVIGAQWAFYTHTQEFDTKDLRPQFHHLLPRVKHLPLHRIAVNHHLFYHSAIAFVIKNVSPYCHQKRAKS